MRARFENRRKNIPNEILECVARRIALGKRYFRAQKCKKGAGGLPGASLGASWAASGTLRAANFARLARSERLLAALGPPGASPDRPWGSIWASQNRPERVRTRPRNGLGRPNQPKIKFSSMFGQFGFHLWINLDTCVRHFFRIDLFY